MKPYLTYILIAVLGGTAGLFWMGEAAFSKTVFHDDSRTMAYWAFKYANGDTFRSDDISAHMRRETADPIPKLMYMSTAPFLDPLWMPTVFAALASAFTALFAYLFGLSLIKRDDPPLWLRHGGAVLFSIACMAIMWNPSMPLCGVGNGGDFLVPLILMAAVGADRKSSWLSGGAAILAAGFYPSAFLVCFGIAALSALKRTNGKWSIEKNMAVASAISIAAAIILHAGSIFSGPDPIIGSVKTWSDISGDPNFQMNGRHPIWIKHWAISLMLSYQSGLMIGIQGFVLLIAVGIIKIFRRKNFGPVNSSVWIMILAGLIFYILAWIFLARLFYPSRYLRGTMQIFIWSLALTAFYHWICDARKKAVRITALVVLGVVVGSLFFLHAKIWPYRAVTLTKGELKLFRMINTMPRETMIAGDPWKIDSAIYIGQRSVLTSFENLMPVFDKYHQEHTQRTYDLFEALYSDSKQDVLGFCKKYKVTHLLLHNKLYEKTPQTKKQYHPRIYVEPFNKFAHEQKAQHKGNYVLNREHFPGELFSGDNMLFVPCTAKALF